MLLYITIEIPGEFNENWPPTWNTCSSKGIFEVNYFDYAKLVCTEKSTSISLWPTIPLEMFCSGVHKTVSTGIPFSHNIVSLNLLIV